MSKLTDTELMALTWGIRDAHPALVSEWLERLRASAESEEKMHLFFSEQVRIGEELNRIRRGGRGD